MDSEDTVKLFVGGIAWETTEDKLRDYFSQYGDVTHAVIMHDKSTGRPRGFGFVHFSDPSVIDSLLQDKHTIDGRQVEAKRAFSRQEQNASRQEQSNAGGGFRTKKVFVGGLPPTITEEGFRQYFENYGHVTDAVIMFDQTTQRPRGFGFITFDSEDSVDRVLHKTFHELDGKDVEVKRALPKEANLGSNNRSGGYQNYGSSRNNSGSYDNRMDGNRFMQPQRGGNFSQYPGYNAAGYGGYGGPTGSYGGYGGYGMGGYGGAAAGFGGQTGAYGGSNAGGAGYGSGPNAMKAGWNNQPGYGSSGYGQGAGYGPSAAWSSTTPTGGSGQYPSGAQGYGHQAYGAYGGYGAVGGHSGSGPTGNSDGIEQTASGGGYLGSGYGDNGRNSGYGGSGWRSDPSQTAGGYGDSQSWQGQQ